MLSLKKRCIISKIKERSDQMFGFLVNAIGVIVGGMIGLLFRKFIKKEYCDAVLKGMGIVVLLVGLFGVIENTVTFSEGKIAFEGTLLLIISIGVGTFIGELLKIDDHLNNFALKLEQKINKGKISEGFITATALYCVGAMTIIGTLNDTLGSPETIYLKSALDMVTSIVLASTLGIGVLFSAGSIIIYQGLLTLVFALLNSVIDQNSLLELTKLISMVGYILVMAIGLNFLIKDKIKVTNMLPAILIPIIYYLGALWLG